MTTSDDVRTVRAVVDAAGALPIDQFDAMPALAAAINKLFAQFEARIDDLDRAGVPRVEVFPISPVSFPGGAGSRWRDSDNDVWMTGDDGLMRQTHKPTAPADVEHVYGPMSLIEATKTTNPTTEGA